MEISTTENSVIVKSLAGLYNGTKNIYLKDNNFEKLCVKDELVSNLSEISDVCSGEGEIDFSSCLGKPVGVNISGILCKDKGGIISLSGLTHSAVVGTPLVEICGDSICNGGETCSSCSGDCGDCPSTGSGSTPSSGGGSLGVFISSGTGGAGSEEQEKIEDETPVTDGTSENNLIDDSGEGDKDFRKLGKVAVFLLMVVFVVGIIIVLFVRRKKESTINVVGENSNL